MSSLDQVYQLYNYVFAKDTNKLRNGLKRVRPNRQQLHELLATALTLNGRQGVAKVLLNHGAPINWNTRNNTYPLSHTPLFMTILKRKDDLTRLLLDHGSNPNQRDAYGFTPLHRASVIPNNEKIIRLLLKKGAGVDAKTPRKYDAFVTPFERGENTPLHIAVHQGGEERNPQEVFKNVRVLVDVGKAKLNLKNSLGETPLHIAARQDASMVHQIQFLIDRGAFINMKNQNGETPLHVAARLLKMHNVKVLLENGAIPFVQNYDNQTPADVAKNFDYFYTPTNVERKIRTWPGERSALRRMATASLNSVRKKSGEQLHIPNNIKRQILSHTGLFRRNQFGRPINTNTTEMRDAWKKEKQRRDRKRKRTGNNT